MAISRFFQYLSWMAEYRVLSTGQMAVLMQCPPRSVRRNLGQLVKGGWLDTLFRPFRECRGRPENLYILTRRGVDQLKTEGMLHRDLPYNRVIWEGKTSLDHQLSLNWIRLSTFQLQRRSSVTISWLAPTSPTTPAEAKDIFFGMDGSHPRESGSTLIPDAVITLALPQGQNTPLCFLEIDRSTESLAGGLAQGHSIKQKILHYQEFYRSQGYKRYEAVFGQTFQGFRVLFVCDTPIRKDKIAQLVRATPGSKFVWLAVEEDLLRRGFGAVVWCVGGHGEEARQSLLGQTRQMETPLPISSLPG